ncbi:MAG: hypothetical protein Q7S95_02030 [bacterium]|nr:hypothetical protein [bacterium]
MANGENDIDSLARMVADGFKEVGKRFDDMGKEMDERFDAVDKRFDKVDTRLDSLEREVRLTNQRIDQVIMPTIDEHSRRIKDLEVGVT